MAAETSSPAAASRPDVGAAAAALAWLICEPIPASSAAALARESGAATTNDIREPPSPILLFSGLQRSLSGFVGREGAVSAEIYTQERAHPARKLDAAGAEPCWLVRAGGRRRWRVHPRSIRRVGFGDPDETSLLARLGGQRPTKAVVRSGGGVRAISRERAQMHRFCGVPTYKHAPSAGGCSCWPVSERLWVILRGSEWCRCGGRPGCRWWVPGCWV